MRLVFGIRRLLLSPKCERKSPGPPRARFGRRRGAWVADRAWSSRPSVWMVNVAQLRRS